MKHLKKTLAVLLIMLMATQGEAAPKTTDDASKIEFKLSPYAWFIGMNGTLGARGRTTDVDFSFSDVREHINFAGMMATEVTFNNRYGIAADINIADLGDQKAHNGVSLSGETRLILSDVAAFYRLVSRPIGKEDSSLMNIDLLAGIRIWDVGLELNLDTPYMGSHRLYRSRDWIDPFVGLRAQFLMNDRWSLIFQGSVGGGGDTSSTWDASARIGWKIGRNTDLLLGYRAVGVNREEGKWGEAGHFIFDTTVHGPMLGLVFRF